MTTKTVCDLSELYDLDKMRPITFDQITKGMLIMHMDSGIAGTFAYYFGIAHELDQDGDTWTNEEGEYVADKECVNYLIPKRRPALPTEGNARIRLVADHPDRRPADVKGDKAGACYTRNDYTGNWVFDGHSDVRASTWIGQAEWELIEVKPVEA